MGYILLFSRSQLSRSTLSGSHQIVWSKEGVLCSVAGHAASTHTTVIINVTVRLISCGSTGLPDRLFQKRFKGLVLPHRHVYIEVGV